MPSLWVVTFSFQLLIYTVTFFFFFCLPTLHIMNFRLFFTFSHFSVDDSHFFIQFQAWTTGQQVILNWKCNFITFNNITVSNNQAQVRISTGQWHSTCLWLKTEKPLTRLQVDLRPKSRTSVASLKMFICCFIEKLIREVWRVESVFILELGHAECDEHMSKWKAGTVRQAGTQTAVWGGSRRWGAGKHQVSQRF